MTHLDQARRFVEKVTDPNNVELVNNAAEFAATIAQTCALISIAESLERITGSLERVGEVAMSRNSADSIEALKQAILLASGDKSNPLWEDYQDFKAEQAES